MVNNLRELVREDEINIRSKEIIHEMNTFAHHPDGKMGAQHGRFDDCVIALCIALMVARLYPPSLRRKEEKRRKQIESEIPIFQFQ